MVSLAKWKGVIETVHGEHVGVSTLSSSHGEGISESAAIQDQQADLLFYAANEVVMC